MKQVEQVNCTELHLKYTNNLKVSRLIDLLLRGNLSALLSSTMLEGKIQGQGKTMKNRSPYSWDYDISESEFRAMVAGELTIGRLGQDWAVVRILEYATYPEIIHTLGYRRLIDG